MNFSTRLGKFREDFKSLQKVVGEKSRNWQRLTRILKTLQLEITKRDAKLEWVDGYLKDLHLLLTEKDTHLAKADREIADLNAVISNNSNPSGNERPAAGRNFFFKRVVVVDKIQENQTEI